MRAASALLRKSRLRPRWAQQRLTSRAMLRSKSLRAAPARRRFSKPCEAQLTCPVSSYQPEPFYRNEWLEKAEQVNRSTARHGFTPSRPGPRLRRRLLAAPVFTPRRRPKLSHAIRGGLRRVQDALALEACQRSISIGITVGQKLVGRSQTRMNAGVGCRFESRRPDQREQYEARYRKMPGFLLFWPPAGFSSLLKLLPGDSNLARTVPAITSPSVMRPLY